MLSRKRKNSLQDYLQSLSTPLEKRQKSAQFHENLRTFYRRKWGFPVKSPYINGKELDLYELYEIVIGLGGWQKVTSFDRWDEVLHKLSFDENIQMAEHAVRSLYLKYLNKFEQNENDGDIGDEHENELLGGRSNRLKGINTMACYYEPPFSVHKISSASSTTPNFHKLIYSLMSGLPNEVAFGLNVLTIMSHPGPFVLNFTNSPQLINVMVAILGIAINPDVSKSCSNLNEWWIECANYNMTKFWMNIGIEEPELFHSIYNPKNIEPKKTDIFESFKIDKFDLNKPINWRVYNVLGIFNNLSFEEFNQKSMGENKALIKFLIMCCNCRYQPLKKPAYETLSNIAKNINLISLGQTFKNVLIKMIEDGLHSNDKLKLLRSMEIISGLCQNTINEILICEFLDRSHIIDRIFTLLPIKDILICIVSLETLHQISELGKTSCELIGSHNVAIDLLIEMLTTDAASFGQTGLYGIKVVEVRGNTMQPYVNPNKKNLHRQNPPNPSPVNQHHLYQTQIHHQQLQTATIPESSTSNDRQTISSKNHQQQTISQILSTTAHNYVQNNYVKEYMCEWMMMALDDDEKIEPCSRFFQSTSQLLYHIYNDHLKTLVQSHSSSKNPENICMIRCRWPMCDNTQRTLWSMTTHLQDVHCLEQNLDANMRRRNELGYDEYTNQIRKHYEENRERDNQHGYSPYAAYEAIRRHAFEYLKKEITDDSEGPVTKNIRLTAALILRNVCKNSVSGRKKLRKHESIMSWLSLSKMESSRILAQCLAEMVSHSSLEVDQQTLNDESLI